MRVLRQREWGVTDRGSVGDLFALDDITPAGVLAAFAITVLGVFLLLVVWPVVALAIELVILLVLFLAALVARILFRRPWRIVARTKGPPQSYLAWDVVGWRASRRVLGEIAEALRAGECNPAPSEARAVELAASEQPVPPAPPIGDYDRFRPRHREQRE